MPLALALLCLHLSAAAPARTAQSGPWSAPSTWEAGHAPAAEADVLVRAGHRVIYDLVNAPPLRSVQVAGALVFADDRSTRLEAGLLVLDSREGLDPWSVSVDAPLPDAAGEAAAAAPLLQIGAPDQPLPAARRAVIRLRSLPGADAARAPAMVVRSGRLELHGAPLARPWAKLDRAASAGALQVAAADSLAGWRVGDRVIVTSTANPNLLNPEHSPMLNVPLGVVPSGRGESETEERTVASVRGAVLGLSQPLAHGHRVHGAHRGEVANLSRNIVIESANPSLARGHVVVHKNAHAALSYVELRHLGQPGALDRYPLLFKDNAATSRGSSVTGCAIWDSGNRWIALRHADYIVLRDNVGYQSVGHGFYLEDGTETRNVWDRNLAVGAYLGQPLPQQPLAHDRNEGANFWWSNSRNVFTRNVAVEGDQYGYRFEAVATPASGACARAVRTDAGPDAPVDARTLPFIRFADNEAHSQRAFGLNLGGAPFMTGAYQGAGIPLGGGALPAEFVQNSVGKVGPDALHPFILRGLLIWATDRAIHSGAPAVLLDQLDVYDSRYALWRCNAENFEVHRARYAQIAEATYYQPWGGASVMIPPGGGADDLEPHDDLAPFTVVTSLRSLRDGSLLARGTAADDRKVTMVRVQGREATRLDPDFATWEIALPAEAWAGDDSITAVAYDAAGHVELTPHRVPLRQEPHVQVDAPSVAEETPP